MKNKNLLFRFGLVAFAITCFGLSFTSATSFKLQIEKMNALEGAISKAITPIHFADNGNDFGGFIYFSSEVKKQKDNCISQGGDCSGDRYDGDCGGEKYDGKCENGEDPVFDEYCPLGDRSGNPNDGDCDWKGEGEGPEEIYPPSEDQTEVYKIFDEDGETVIKECLTQVKGFYYNAERGERLWPLDEETWSNMPSMQKLSTSGGIYTACRNPGYAEKACEECEGGIWENGICGCEDDRKDMSGYCMTEEEQTCEGENCPEVVDSAVCTAEMSKQFEADLQFYGKVMHKYPTDSDKPQTFGFVVGTTYNFQNNGDWISIPSLKSEDGVFGPTFIMFDQQRRMGLVYDYNGGIGFAGCEIKSNANSRNILEYIYDRLMEGNLEEQFLSSNDGVEVMPGSQLEGAVECTNIGLAANSLIKVIVEGLVGMNRESDFSLVGNQLDQKMQYFSSADINNATILNYAKKKSEQLCRGKWKDVGDNIDGDDVICLDLKGQKIIASPEYFKGKTLIAKNGGIVISPETKVHDEGGDKYYDIFLSNGTLFINEANDTRKFAFNTQGFVVEDHAASNDDVLQYYKGELADLDSSDPQKYKGELSGVGSLIRGNFIVDGKIKGVSQDNDGKLHNKYFIHGKFTTRDSFKDLENTFVWRCSDGYVVDKDGNILEEQGRYCPPSLVGVNGKIEWMNPYESAALVVIDQNYDSPLYW